MLTRIDCECGGARNHGCRRADHAVFSAGGPVSISAGGCVSFDACGEENDYFDTSYGSILIRRPGMYYVAVTVDIPKNTEIDTVMRLELDNRNLTPPEIAVATTGDCITSNFTGHTVFYANAGSLLKLTSLRDLDVNCTTAQPVFTLTLIRMK